MVIAAARFAVNRDDPTPLYRQLVEQIRRAVESGALPAGSRLPTVRQLALDLGLTRLTVHSAYEELQADGLIESHVGRGTFVAEAARLPATVEATSVAARPRRGGSMLAELLQMVEQPQLLSFAQAFPAPETYPGAALQESLQRVLDEPSALSYGPMYGEPALREQLVPLLRRRGLHVRPDDILITSGAQQGVDLALRALTAPGDAVLTQAPIYPGFLEIAAGHGRRLIGVPTSGENLDLNRLEAICRAERPRLMYTNPTYHNPTGRSLSARARAGLLELARRYGFTIVEDDVYGFVAYDAPAPPALAAAPRGAEIVYVMSFSKILAPALRLGALIANPDTLLAASSVKHGTDLVVSSLLQRAVADFLSRGLFEAHLARACPIYRERRDALLAALRDHLEGSIWTEPEGGLSLWVQLPDVVDERVLAHEAIGAGVGIARGEAFFAEPSPHPAMRLSFGQLAPDAIHQGMTILGEIVAGHVQRRRPMFARLGQTEPLV